MTKKRGSRPRFAYQKKIDTFFSSPEMEVYFLDRAKKEGYVSMRLCLHNILLKIMNEDENSNYLKTT